MPRPTDAPVLTSETPYLELKGHLLLGSLEPEALQAVWRLAQDRVGPDQRGFLLEHAARYMVGLDPDLTPYLLKYAAVAYDEAAKWANEAPEWHNVRDELVSSYRRQADNARDAMAALQGPLRASTSDGAGLERQMRRFQREGNPERVWNDVQALADPIEQLTVLADAISSPKFADADRKAFTGRVLDWRGKDPSNFGPFWTVLETMQALAAVDETWKAQLASLTKPVEPAEQPVAGEVPIRPTSTPNALPTLSLPSRGLV